MGNGSTPACPPLGDEPLDATTALLFSRMAPQAPPGRPGTCPNRSDSMAVWACVTPGFNPGAPVGLLFFHGHNNWVTVERTSRGAVRCRVPDWIPDRPLSGGDQHTNPFTPARAKAASSEYRQGCGHRYGLDSLDGLTPSSSHRPLVLLPEVGHLDRTYDRTLVPTVDRHGVQRVDRQGRPMFQPRQAFYVRESAHNVSRFPAMFDDCASKLTRISPPGSTTSYLPATPAVTFAGLRRFFLLGHSGGGVPLWAAVREAARSSIPTRVGVWDATYSDGTGAIRAFCEAAHAAGRLNTTAAGSSVVIVFNPDSDTQARAVDIVSDLRQGGAGRTVFTVTEVRRRSPTDDAAIATAIGSQPIVVVHTDQAHEDIPGIYTRMLLQNTP